MPPMKLRPAVRVAEAMWAQQFKGEAVNINAMYGEGNEHAAVVLLP